MSAMSPLAMAMLCAWNNIPPDKAPPEWTNQPGPTVEAWERVAKAMADTTARAVQEQCPACSGSGHADDSTADNPQQCPYCGIPGSAIYNLLKTPETNPDEELVF